jgi:hypothetical protein
LTARLVHGSRWPASASSSVCARLLGAARQIRKVTSIHLTMIEGRDPQDATGHAMTVLGAKRFAAAADTAKQFSLDEVLRSATVARAFSSAP